MTTTLNPNQQVILQRAVDDSGGKIVWFPDHIKGGARAKVLEALLKRALITRDGYDNYFVAAEGYAALGRDVPAPATIHPDPEVETALATKEAEWAREYHAASRQQRKVAVEGKPRSRADSKQAEVIRMLQRPEGVTIGQICEATGWRAHTTRGFLAGTVKRKLGLILTSEKPNGQERIYRAAEP